MTGIYQIVNTTNGKRYIGSAVDMALRRNGHWKSLRRGTHHAVPLQRAWHKYGEAAFEQRCFDALRPAYNVAPTAGSQLGMKYSAESRARIAAANRIRSPESRAKTAAAARMMWEKIAPANRSPSPESRVKMSASARSRSPESRIVSPEARANIAAAARNRSPEHRAKLRAAALNPSPETRARLSAAARKRDTPEWRAMMAAARRRCRRVR
jgi:GIY-YIG catalytic domain